ncbi:hypothetical protein [Nostocoides vanveenii]|uniref:Uncharacterized protein n=1 Tax=Nostocoides vanveenii TaxID=330835 RepID=A0ABN2KDS1_9MICO
MSRPQRTIALIGPIDGYAGNNQAAFAAATSLLQARGWVVVPHTTAPIDRFTVASEVERIMSAGRVAVLPGIDDDTCACALVVLAKALGVRADPLDRFADERQSSRSFESIWVPADESELWAQAGYVPGDGYGRRTTVDGDDELALTSADGYPLGGQVGWNAGFAAPYTSKA